MLVQRERFGHFVVCTMLVLAVLTHNNGGFVLSYPITAQSYFVCWCSVSCAC